jgi:hypothetical protein
MLRKILVATATISTIVISTLGTTYAAQWTKGVDCGSDPVFAANSCNQCFVETKAVKQGDNIASLKDAWMNNTSTKLLMLKNEQQDPQFKSLAWNKFEITKKTINGKFWETPSSLKKIYDEDLEGYLLEPGKNVDWIQTTLWAAYKVTKNDVAKWENAWLLIYTISTHAINGDDINEDATTHRECVLYKSAGPAAKPKTNDVAVKVKDNVSHATKQTTGPEMYILILLAILMGAFLIKRKA